MRLQPSVDKKPQLSYMMLKFMQFLQQASVSSPWYNRSRKKWEPLRKSDLTKFQAQSRWLATYLMRFAKKLGSPIQVFHCRPRSFVLGFWTSCVLLKLPQSRIEQMDRCFQQWKPIFRRPMELHDIGTSLA